MAGENINRRLNIYINDREVVNSMRGVSGEMSKVRNEIRNLNKNASDYDDRLKKLKDTYSKLQAQQAAFRKDAAETKGMLGQLKAALGPVGAQFLAAFSIATIISTATSKIREAWQAVVDFDQKQADLAATMQKSRLQVAGLTLDAIKLGAGSAYSANEVSELQIELAKLGKSGSEIKKMTPDVLDAATALETNLANAAVLVGGQLNSYGESADKAGKFSDILANSVNISATSYDYLATSLPKVSSVAAINNVTFEKANAILGVLADQNIAAETAGTGFRNILLESSKAGKNYEVMLREIATANDQSKKATELFGKENAAVAVILANSTEKIKSNTEALENSAGSAERLAKEKLNSIKGSIEGFSGAWEGFILSIEKGDGFISKAVRGLYDFGASFLNLITPMKKVSDLLQEEQLGLNMLASQITSTNLKNDDRKKLIMQLNDQYPEFTKNLDLEKVTNEQISKALNKVNEEYVKRIALQQSVEELEGAQQKQGQQMADRLKFQEKAFKELNKVKTTYRLTVDIDYNDLKKSAEKMRAELKKKGRTTSYAASGQMDDVDDYLSYMGAYESATEKAGKKVAELNDALNRQQQSLGIQTEAQREASAAAADHAEQLKKLREQAKGMGMKNADSATEQEVRLWIAAQKEKLKYSDEVSEKEKNKMLREAEARKKHTEDLAKAEDDLQKRLLELKRNGEDAHIDALHAGFEKERAEINADYDRKIQDAQNNVIREQREIEKLRSAIASSKTSPEDKASYKRQLDDRLQIQEQYSSIALSLDSTRISKLRALNEKYNLEAFKKEQEASARAVQNLKTRHAIELSEINSLKTAKAYLSQYLDSEELAKIKTLAGGRKKIKEIQAREEYELEEQNVQKIMDLYQMFLDMDFASGFQMMSPEERDAMIGFLDQASAKMAEIRNGKQDQAEGDEGETKQISSGIDVLGYDPEKWEEIFTNLDDFQAKLSAIQMVAGVLTEAFSTYFKFLEAGENRTLQNFQRATDKKKRALSDQLDRGFISQAVYNAKVEKLEQDLNKKKAEIEYKQAKRQKAMAIANAIVNTALGIMNAYATSANPIIGTVFAALIAGVGALQIATIAKQPLPDRSGGFKDGGYTGDGAADEYAGPAHKGEYYIPKRVLFSNDPVVPNIVGYLEAKRTGRSVSNGEVGQGDVPAGLPGGGPNSSEQLANLAVINRLTVLLERLEKNGLTAILENNLKTAKQLRDKIKELETFESEKKL